MRYAQGKLWVECSRIAWRFKLRLLEPMSTPIRRVTVPIASASEAPARAVASDRFWLGAFAVLIVGIAARQLLLGQAPFHPDEAIHAFFAQGFGGYTYDPIYHGPLLYHLVAATFGIFGEHDFTARLVPSLLGVGLIALILFPTRRFVSNRAALAGAALVAVSPSIIAYSRHLLHDSLVLFLTMGAVLCFSHTLNHPSDSAGGRWARIGLAAFLSLFLATKANFFFILVMLGAFWIAWRASGLLRLPTIVERWLPWLCFAGVTVVAIAFPRDNTFLPELQKQQHLIFQVFAVSGCAVFWLWLMSRRPTDEERDYKRDWRVSGDLYSRLVALFSPVGQREREHNGPHIRPSAVLLTYVLAGAAALWIYLFLYGQGAQILGQWIATGSFPDATAIAGRTSARTALAQMWDYWGGQQATPRLPGRHDYYVVLALLYEVPILIAAVGGIWHAAKQRSAFTDLLMWWAFTSWTIYAVANEKVPWLLVHICLPLALLGGVWLGQLKVSRPLWIIGVALGAFFSLRTDWALIFGRAGDNAEPILYAQTPDAFRDSVQTMLADTRGDARTLWMHNERQWPSVWYFREGAPDVGESGISLGGQLDILSARAGVTTDADIAAIGAMTSAGWHTETATFLIWPRASWTALEPRRYWRWFWTRDTFPKSERGLPQAQWETSILAGQGEWSNADAVVGWRKSNGG